MNCPLGAITPRSGPWQAQKIIAAARSNFLFLAAALSGGNVCGFIFAIRSNKIMINLWLSTVVDWKLFITKSLANPIRSFAEFLFGRIKFCKSWGKYCKYPRGTLPNTTRSKSIKSDRTSSELRLFLQYSPIQLFIQLLSHSQYPVSVGRMASVSELMNMADILANPVVIKTPMMNLGSCR